LKKIEWRKFNDIIQTKNFTIDGISSHYPNNGIWKSREFNWISHSNTLLKYCVVQEFHPFTIWEYFFHPPYFLAPAT
jgi:hypothetical protein